MGELVHRLELDAPHPAASDDGFHLLAGPRDAVRLAGPLRRRLGLRGAARAAAKIATRRRLLYCLVRSGAIVHDGWLTVSHSDLFPVDEGDVVIGPIRTDPDHRGQGLAALGLRLAMNAMLARGHRVFLISASEQNAASRRAIAKAGFGPPIATRNRPRRSADRP